MNTYVTVTEKDVLEFIKSQPSGDELARQVNAKLEVERKQKKQEQAAELERLRNISENDTRLYVNAVGELRLRGDDKPKSILGLEGKTLKSPLLPTLYEFELPAFPTMVAYRTGSLTKLTSYWRSDDEIVDALTRKLGRKPTDNEVFAERNKVQDFSNRFEVARPYEVYVAQLLWNVGLTPFLDSAVDVSQHPNRDEMLKTEQADISVAGKLVEVKSFYHLHSRTVKIDGEAYVFMCSTSSYNRQQAPRDYYVLVCKSSLKEDIEDWQALRDLGVEEYKPLVVPVDRAKLVEHEWTDSKRGGEIGIFVRKEDLITFNSFVRELRQHHNQMKKQSRKLDTHEIMRLFYPNATDTELAGLIARENKLLREYNQRVFDF